MMRFATALWCPFFKTKVLECNNYRGIELMSHTMKAWEKVIERRLREESDISQKKFGFMPGRGAPDTIFAIRQLCEKYRAHKNLHMVFVDLEKAYDRVPREVLWWALKGVPEKYVQLIRAMYSQCNTQVRSTAGSGACCRLQQQLQCGCRLTSRVGSQPLPLPDDNRRSYIGHSGRVSLVYVVRR
ncbi:hypothetical protein PYW08_011923 [Mythimna loreyi]|uniref:Uncharacterized protein n=1 Tax=Mythimna loreyi TaxID=667449 RepID=A0ACC2QKS4_9NEOP|nr:hypothetical protein PYW08_011923 [Mythimna loreyi]